MNQKTKKRYGFPNYFKKIGLGIIILAFIPILLKLISAEIPIENGTMKLLFTDLMIIGLCLIILSEDRIEDEMTFQLKLAEFVGSFIFIVVFLIFTQILNLFLDGTMMVGFTAEQVVLFMCSTHLAMHYMNKWQRRRAENKNDKIENQ